MLSYSHVLIKSINYNLCSYSFLTLITCLISSCTSQEDESKLVRRCFENYKSAIHTDKGVEAVKFVDSRTIKYYDHISELTKNADSAKVNSLPLMDKIMVFSIRHRATKEDILSFDGKGLLIYAIKTGMVAKNGVATITIGDVTYTKDFAKGQFITNGQKTPIYYNFYKENQQRKIDLTSLFSVSTMAFKKMVTDSGQSENECLFSLLEIVTGKKPGNYIWDAVK